MLNYMEKKIKKGDVVELVSRLSALSHETVHVVGVVSGISEKELVLIHNFLGTNPIDVTTVPSKNILRLKKVIPREINLLKDLKNDKRAD